MRHWSSLAPPLFSHESPPSFSAGTRFSENNKKRSRCAIPSHGFFAIFSHAKEQKRWGKMGGWFVMKMGVAQKRSTQNWGPIIDTGRFKWLPFFYPPLFLVFYFKSPHLIKFGIPEIPQHKGNKHSKTYCVISKLAPLIIKTTSHSLCKKFKDSFLKEWKTEDGKYIKNLYVPEKETK